MTKSYMPPDLNINEILSGSDYKTINFSGVIDPFWSKESLS